MNIDFSEETGLNYSPRIHPWERGVRDRKIFARVFCGLMMGIENWAGWFIKALARPSLVSKQRFGCFETGPSSECSEQAKGTQVSASRSKTAIKILFFQWLKTYLSLERDRIWLATIQREGSAGIRLLLFLGLLLLFIPAKTSAQNTIEVDFRGYVKELGSLSLSNDFETLRYDNILHHRIESRFGLGEYVEFRADVRTRLFNGWTVQNTPGYGKYLSNDPGYVDLSHTWIDEEKVVLNSAIDRLHFSYINGPWEVHAGRQRINWGKTMVWNPNDLFNAYAYLDFDYEERPGTDAFSASYSWSYASSVEAGYRLGDSFDESVLAGMFRGSVGEYDVQLIAANYFEQLALGGGWSGYIKSAGFKGEITYFHPRNDFWDESGHVTATLGGDYMFPNAVYASAELLYNGGWDRSVNPVAQLTRPPSADDLFIAETGYFVNAAYQLNPLTSLTGGVMGSFDRKMVILIPQFTRSLSNNLDLLILAQLLKGSALSDLTETPNVLYFRLKWSY
ncbi:hypothetical protein [Gracilimonas mengyeensis]|uniref:Alginate export n=1 Tax=Gracilimonas mengyeensis TaxID=1302730 RepID=A0A521BFL1_9BACT|nr:hypothetical protein [Gracilimonas mengyeensis]SMO45859.1 hypothetical protein SAMN06265219_102247 [Gracilimonas mengyeensis]